MGTHPGQGQLTSGLAGLTFPTRGHLLVCLLHGANWQAPHRISCVAVCSPCFYGYKHNWINSGPDTALQLTVGSIFSKGNNGSGENKQRVI